MKQHITSSHKTVCEKPCQNDWDSYLQAHGTQISARKAFIGLYFLLQFKWVSGIKELDRKIACESACKCQECQLRDPETLHSSTARSLLVNFLNIVTANIKITHSIKLKGMTDFCINCFKSSLSLKKDSDRIISS